MGVGALLEVNWFGLAGWQWVFLAEGLPAVAPGRGRAVPMTDLPGRRGGSTPAERDWLEGDAGGGAPERGGRGGRDAWQALRPPAVWLLALGILATNTGGYACVFWLPTAVEGLLTDGAGGPPPIRRAQLDRPGVRLRPGGRLAVGPVLRPDRRPEVALRRGQVLTARPGGERHAGPIVGRGLRLAVRGRVLRLLLAVAVLGAADADAVGLRGGGRDRLHQYLRQRRGHHRQPGRGPDEDGRAWTTGRACSSWRAVTSGRGDHRAYSSPARRRKGFVAAAGRGTITFLKPPT